MTSLPREFRKTPLILLSCIAVLAIGIGGATAAFSALYTIVLRPLSYPNPQQLVAVHSQFPRLQMDHSGVSPLDYLDLRQHKDLFSDAGAFFYLDLSRTGQLHAEKVNALAITSSLLTSFGVRPQIGRSFQPVEEQPGGPHVALLSDAYWKSTFGGDPNILRRSLELNGERYSVVGVMPRSFTFPNDVTQMWVPVVFKPSWLGHGGRQNVFLACTHVYRTASHSNRQHAVSISSAVMPPSPIAPTTPSTSRAGNTSSLRSGRKTIHRCRCGRGSCFGPSLFCL